MNELLGTSMCATYIIGVEVVNYFDLLQKSNVTFSIGPLESLSFIKIL